MPQQRVKKFNSVRGGNILPCGEGEEEGWLKNGISKCKSSDTIIKESGGEYPMPK